MDKILLFIIASLIHQYGFSETIYLENVLVKSYQVNMGDSQNSFTPAQSPNVILNFDQDENNENQLYFQYCGFGVVFIENIDLANSKYLFASIMAAKTNHQLAFASIEVETDASSGSYYCVLKSFGIY